MDTTFAPAERYAADDVRDSFDALKARIPYDVVLNLIPGMSMIVNDRRQVLFANDAALSTFGLEGSEIAGARPGELLRCTHAFETAGGCGGSETCRLCGANAALLAAIEGGGKASGECRITTKREGRSGCLDLRVTAAPMDGADGRYVMVTMDDISDLKRREVLERLFFHDLMNSLSSLQAGLGLIDGEFGSLASEHDYLERTTRVMKRLIDEVIQQKQILTMEKGDLETDKIDFDLGALARDIVRTVEIADYAKGRRIGLYDERAEALVRSDPTLLRRVMVNMLKNALEASEPGEEVAVELRERGPDVEIAVRNSAFMPRQVQLQVFQRSFSTKGLGRGLGTYSMKMLTENYLDGKVEFGSEEGAGTTFRAILPGRGAKGR
jgi:nitrogen fixation/metabolism regulation signal transduction histidine kinase